MQTWGEELNGPRSYGDLASFGSTRFPSYSNYIASSNELGFLTCGLIIA